MTTAIPKPTSTSAPLTDEALFAKYYQDDHYRLRTPIPNKAAYRDEAYRVFLEFLVRYTRVSHSRVLDRGQPLQWGWDRYWNTWCIEEALRRGDVVREGRKLIRFVHGANLPKTPEEIREKLNQIENQIAAGEDSAAVCFKHGITPQRLGVWRRKYSGWGGKVAPELDSLRAENQALREQLAEKDRMLKQVTLPSAADAEDIAFEEAYKQITSERLPVWEARALFTAAELVADSKGNLHQKALWWVRKVTNEIDKRRHLQVVAYNVARSVLVPGHLPMGRFAQLFTDAKLQAQDEVEMMTVATRWAEQHLRTEGEKTGVSAAA